MDKSRSTSTKNPLDLPHSEIIKDYRIAFISRQASLLGRKEVLGGRAKFGIFGDGKEIAQIAWARAFRKGDWRSGYYRDQTFMFAIGASDVRKFFAQLYADSDIENEPSSGGRQMNAHFSSRFLDKNGQWLNQCLMHNSSADLSPTAGQMGRSLGLAYASKMYRQLPDLEKYSQYSVRGNEISFVTIGDASTSEGIFWETLNAAGVLQVPLCVSVWDDGFGISVPTKYQTTKSSISEATAGFAYDEQKKSGFHIYKVAGWDYSSLYQTYQRATERTRKDHIPALIHVVEITQPQGHSTSGSHERYKNAERMSFEQEFDGIARMRKWMLAEGIASDASLRALEEEAIQHVTSERDAAWAAMLKPIEAQRDQILAILDSLRSEVSQPQFVEEAQTALKRAPILLRRVVTSISKRLLYRLGNESAPSLAALRAACDDIQKTNQHIFDRYTLHEGERAQHKLRAIPARYTEKPEMIDGSQIIQRAFNYHLKNNPKLFILGEDVGHLGGVNTEFDGLQEAHGLLRVTDTGIREATILGQGIGAAMRGLRPVVDIQYLDYVLYCLQIMSDDLATLHYRSAGGQMAPVIVRTKGHRLEGIWHTGSPMGTLLGAIRGMYLCVPRNMVQAAGMYNTLLKGDNPALVIEVLNGYRLKEALPDNLHEFCVPLGVPEVVLEGSDLTVVTYGACVRIALDAASFLKELGISIEVIDVQTLLPFDTPGIIAESLAKTNTVLFLDEDVPGGAAAYMMQQTLEANGGFDLLDAPPRTLSAAQHRGAYASDGDYFSKPNAEQIIDVVLDMLQDRGY